MIIQDYIVFGGENLNSPSVKTPSFPQEAETQFFNWWNKLGNDDHEPENFLELPVADSYRLYMKQYWVEKPGHRPICYYVGFILTADMFREAKEYYLLSKGISSISLDEILTAKVTLSPISFSISFPLPQSSIWKPFDELSSMCLYGKEDYNKNYVDMCSSISVNNLDDWFTRLFIAVNPYRLNSEYNLILSREKPRPEITSPSPSPTAPQKNSNDKPKTSQRHPNDYSRLSSLKAVNLPTSFVILVLSIFLCFIMLMYVQFNTVSKKKYDALRAENAELQKTNENLEAECGRLNQENTRLNNENSRLKSGNKPSNAEELKDEQNKHQRINLFPFPLK